MSRIPALSTTADSRSRKQDLGLAWRSSSHYGGTGPTCLKQNGLDIQQLDTIVEEKKDRKNQLPKCWASVDMSVLSR